MQGTNTAAEKGSKFNVGFHFLGLEFGSPSFPFETFPESEVD